MSEQPKAHATHTITEFGLSGVVLVIGVIMIILAAFGVQPIDDADLGLLGIATCFASRFF